MSQYRTGVNRSTDHTAACRRYNCLDAHHVSRSPRCLRSRAVLPASLRILQLHAGGGARRSDRRLSCGPSSASCNRSASRARSTRCSLAAARPRICRRTSFARSIGQRAQWFPLAAGYEFSVEANPADLDERDAGHAGRLRRQSPEPRRAIVPCGQASSCSSATTRPISCAPRSAMAKRVIRRGVARPDLRHARRNAGSLAGRSARGARDGAAITFQRMA